MTLHHSQANLTGTVEATSHHPDGRELVRIADHWLFKDECEAEVNEENQPVFTVQVGDRQYSIWADGRIDGFAQDDAPVLVANRIPQVMRDVVGQCLTLSREIDRVSAEMV